MGTVRRRTWGVACVAVAGMLAVVALVVVASRIRVILDHPLSFATLVLAVAVIGTIACAREARRSLT